jgi:predicted dehydrogenase
MTDALRLGVIGLSPGNGHPYSWSAICNGYDVAEMASCPFPVIPRYLAKQSFPNDQIPGARVTHVWTQNEDVSRHIARSARIANVVRNYQDMVGVVDAVLLARDDAENHLSFAAPFLDAGCPIFIDKPLAHQVAGARLLLERQRFEGQIFSCSALRYARELRPDPTLGTLLRIDARGPNRWPEYAVHLIEPALAMLDFPTTVEVLKRRQDGDLVSLEVRAGNALVTFTTTGTEGSLEFHLVGENGSADLQFDDAFAAFKVALEEFIRSVRTRSPTIPIEQTLSVIRLIEAGSV